MSAPPTRSSARNNSQAHNEVGLEDPSIASLYCSGWIGCESLQQCLRTCSLYNNILQRYSSGFPDDPHLNLNMNIWLVRWGETCDARSPPLHPNPMCVRVMGSGAAQPGLYSQQLHKAGFHEDKVNMYVCCVRPWCFPLLIAFLKWLRMS